MSKVAPQPTPRESDIRNARLRLIELEIEAHRVKAELARLEAAREDAAADRLSSQLPTVDGGYRSTAPWKRVVQPMLESAEAEDAEADVPEMQAAGNGELPRRKQSTRKSSPPTTAPSAPSRQKRNRKSKRAGWLKSLRATPAWLVSLGFHVVILLLCGLLTFVTFHGDVLPLMASSLDAVEETLEEPTEIEFDSSELEENELEEVVLEASEFELSDSPLSDLAPLSENVGLAAPGEVGFVDTLASDLGTLMAGSGGGGEVGGGGRRAARFFGAAAEGKRFVFLVDNSGSMNEGRIETTFLELLSSVGSMQPDQYFYVIFYSDQAYPMFYPEATDRLVPATTENKQRLQDWLETVELCTGGRLIQAMEMAIELKPQVVYILSDGAFYGSSTMPFMTESTDWPFVVHTLGMNVKREEHAANLAQIAAAHRGTFKLVQPSPAAIEMSRRRPINYNNRGPGPVWGSKVRRR